MANQHLRKRDAFRVKAISVAVACCFSVSVQSAFANPTGATVASGAASFNTQGNVLSVTNSPGAIINWRGFSIGANEITRFIQLSSASSVLNRVVGVDPSIILGVLQSNGRVFLINPNGILFGAGAQIDVAGLVASTLNLSNADFLAGRMRFTETPGAGSINNQGAITTPTGGQVYLIAPDVQNSGIITSPQGEVILAAGRSVEIVDAGTPNLRVALTAPDTQAVNVGQIIANSGRIGIYAGLIQNSGIIKADGVVVGQNGEILLKATNNVTLDSGSIVSASGAEGGKVTIQSGDTTLVSGTVEAKGSDGQGGTVKVLGDHVGLLDNAAIDASGQTGGGYVMVGGDFHGANPDVKNATATYVSPTAMIHADAIQSGDGGNVAVWSNDVTRFYGTISATGGAQGGNGGFVETSGHNYLDFAGMVDTRAPQGKTGTLLLDPKNIDVNDTGGSAYGGNNLFADNAGGDSIIAATGAGSISAQTSNVLLQADNDITFTSAVNIANAGTTLTAQAGRQIWVNADITTNNANISLTANETTLNGVNAANRDPGTGGISMATGTSINAGTGDIVLRVANGSGHSGATTASSIVVENLTGNNVSVINDNLNSGSSIILNSDVLATAGITMQAAGDLTQIGGNISNAATAGTNDISLSGNNVTLGSVASQHDLFVTASGALQVGGASAFGAQNFHWDDNYFAYTLPFTFNFYGTPYSTAYIASNGIVTFGSGTSQYSDDTSFLQSYRIIAPAWNDWVTAGTNVNGLPNDVYIANSGAGLTVRWAAQRFSSGVPAQFETVLGRTGNITFNYGPASSSFAGDVTIGLSNQSAASTVVSQLMSLPGFSLNRLNSTTFSYSAVSGSYSEVVSATSNWSTSLAGNSTSNGVVSALRNAILSADSITVNSGLTTPGSALLAANNVAFNGLTTVSGALSVIAGSTDVNATVQGGSVNIVTNALNVNGGDFQSVAGNFVGTVYGDVNVSGGGRIYGSPDVDLTVDGTIFINGTGSKIEAGSPSSIHVLFPLRADGGYLVNGAPVVWDGESGFVADGLPAVLGQNLLIDYGSGGPPPPDVISAINSTIAAINQSDLTSSDKDKDKDKDIGKEKSGKDEKSVGNNIKMQCN